MAMDLTSPEWVKKRAQEIRRSEKVLNLQLQARMLETWAHLRPKMMLRLRLQGVANDLAVVLQAAMWAAVDQYEKAGMPPTDARETAEREWLMLEPETDEETTTSLTLSS